MWVAGAIPGEIHKGWNRQVPQAEQGAQGGSRTVLVVGLLLQGLDERRRREIGRQVQVDEFNGVLLSVLQEQHRFGEREEPGAVLAEQPVELGAIDSLRER